MASGDVHVTKNDGRWAVKGEGSARATSTHDTQKAAIAAGRAQAKRNKSELLVHGRDGKIRDRSSYGNDPRRTKG